MVLADVNPQNGSIHFESTDALCPPIHPTEHGL